MSVLIIIPARYASQRFPAKPLAQLTGASGESKSLIHRSWDAANMVNGVAKVVVATDDDRIRTAAEAFGADVVMTSQSCTNGTERCAEAYEVLGGDYDVVVNLQGDAPLTPHWFVEELIAQLSNDKDVKVATPVLRCDGRALNGFLNDRHHGRVGGTTAVFDRMSKALYFSKEVIPFVGQTYEDQDATPVFHHVGVYAYRADALLIYPKLDLGTLEQHEGLEQLRFMENGIPVQCVEVQAKGKQFWELNNPEDVEIIESMMKDMELY